MSSIEKISLAALTGIFVTILSLFLGKERREERNDYALTISEYRKAVEANPDYLDAKSDEIKKAIKEAIFEWTEREKKNPDDKIAKQGLKDAYYLRRKFGGGCE